MSRNAWMTATTSLLLTACGGPEKVIAEGGYWLDGVLDHSVERDAFPEAFLEVSSTKVRLDQVGRFLDTELWDEDGWLSGCPTQRSVSRMETWNVLGPMSIEGVTLEEPMLIAVCDGERGEAEHLWLTSGDGDGDAPCSTATTCLIFRRDR